MSTYRRLILTILPAMLLPTACTARISPVPTPAPTQTRISTQPLTLTPSVTRLPTASFTPTVAVPSLDSFNPVARLSLADSEHVLDMSAGPDGAIWLVTDQRVLHYYQGTWTNYLSQFSGAMIGMDSDQHVWAVSADHAAVSVWDGSAWNSMGPETGWEPLPVPDTGLPLGWSLATDAQGQVWLANGRDVRVFDGQRWKIFTLEDLELPLPDYEYVLPETTVTSLKANASIWLMSCYWMGPGPDGRGGARWYDGHTWQGSDSPVADGCATVINEDRLGNIWLGLDNDLWRLDSLSGNWERFPAPDPPVGNSFGFFTDLALDPSGNPWPELAICGGASCYAGNVRYHVTPTEWLQLDAVGMDNSSLYFDAARQGWVFTSGGVFHLAGDQLEPVAEMPILKVTLDPSGKLWMVGIYKKETVLWAQAIDM